MCCHFLLHLNCVTFVHCFFLHPCQSFLCRYRYTSKVNEFHGQFFSSVEWNYLSSQNVRPAKPPSTAVVVKDSEPRQLVQAATRFFFYLVLCCFNLLLCLVNWFWHITGNKCIKVYKLYWPMLYSVCFPLPGGLTLLLLPLLYTHLPLCLLGNLVLCSLIRPINKNSSTVRDRPMWRQI